MFVWSKLGLTFLVRLSKIGKPFSNGGFLRQGESIKIRRVGTNILREIYFCKRVEDMDNNRR